MKKRAVILRIVLILVLFVSMFVYYFNVVSPVIYTYSSAKTEALSEAAINMAVSTVINRTLSYDSLIDITYNNSGEIVAFSANQYEINSISREIVNEAQTQMETLGEDGLPINVGTFTGVPFFIGRGPIINLRLVPIGAVASRFSSEFDSVGINMTKHTLFLYVDVHVSIVMPVKSFEIFSSIQVMLAECIIIGKVPEVYLNGGSLGEALNLVP